MPDPNRLIVITTLALGGTMLHAEPPPQAPKGFSWTNCTPMKGRFLKPDGWYFLEEVKGGTIACYITKEKINPPAGFQTGVSINLIKEVQKKTSLSPSDYAKRYLAAIEGKYAIIKRVGSSRGPFTHFAAEFISTDGTNEPIRMWHILIANDRTGSLHLAVAESPANAWAQNWPTLEVVVSMLGVDDEV